VCAAAVALTAMAVPSEAPPTTDTDSAPAAVLPEFTVNTDPSFNGLGEVPAMGWSSWAAFRMDVSADRLIEQAETLVSSGLAAAGYRYVNVDSGWMLSTRDADGNLVVDPDKFPGGLQPVVDAIHDMGLKFGIYTDASDGKACGDLMTGSYGHEQPDFEFFLSLGVDYLKVDGCYVNVIDNRPYPEIATEAFGIWSTLILESGATVYLSQQGPAYAWIFDPGFHAEMAEWSATVSNSWRTGTDIANADQPTDVQWQTIVTNLDYTLPLIAGNGISLGEAGVQFGAWAMLSAPLLMSTDLTDLSADELDLLTNSAVIAVDQDPAASRAASSRDTTTSWSCSSH